MHSLRDIIFPVQAENQNKEIFPFTSAYFKYNSQIQSKQHLLQLHSGHFFLQKKNKKHCFFSSKVVCMRLKCSSDELAGKMGDKFTVSLLSLMPSTIRSPALLCSIHQHRRNPALRYEIALHTPIRLKSPTSHSAAFYLLSQNQVQALSLKAFISGELTWQQGGFLSSELSIKASGIMCQLALLEDLCVFFQAVIRYELVPSTWVTVKWFRFCKIQLLLLALRYPAKAFLSQSQKRAFTGETGFSACFYTPH